MTLHQPNVCRLRALRNIQDIGMKHNSRGCLVLQVVSALTISVGMHLPFIVEDYSNIIDISHCHFLDNSTTSTGVLDWDQAVTTPRPLPV